MPDLGPEHVDPEQVAFNEIVQRERHAEMLRIATPPWDIAATHDTPGLPTQRQYMSREAAQAICGPLLREAAFMDVLFVPTFSTAVNMARWERQLVPSAQRNVTTLIDDAAFLVRHIPNPGDALQLHEQMEHAAEKRGDYIMHQQFIAASDVFRGAFSAPEADMLATYAQASLSLSRRQVAFERVLMVMYGKRYDFWQATPDLS